MLVLGVIDLLARRAVHARGGHRERYEAVPLAGGAAPGDAVAIARDYVDRLGIPEIYVADLDAILGRAPQDDVVRAIAALGAPVWLDDAITSVQHARRALGLGAARVVVGLETLPSFELLETLCTSEGGARVAFSLDLRDGQPVVLPQLRSSGPPAALAARAAEAGVGSIIVIDLARVGSGRGLDLKTIRAVREAARGPALLAGGGVRSLPDLESLAQAGCDGAMVASALRDGRIGAAEVAAALRL